jgi:hypothetical protein
MWPALFGSWCWKFLHAMAYEYKNHTFTVEESFWIERFITIMFSNLPCPSNCYHAMTYITNNKPTFTNGQQCWDYLHMFHNVVNTLKHQPSVTISNEEAEESLRIQMGNLGFKLEELQDAFVDDFWIALFLISREITNRIKLQDFLVASCFAFPFSRRASHDGKLVRDAMLESLTTFSFHKDKDGCLEPITNMYNCVAPVFDESEKSIDEMKELLQHHFCVADYPIFVKAQELHVKNQVKIMEYQKQLKIPRHKPCGIIQRAQEMLEEDQKKITLLEKQLGIFVI